VGAEVVDREDVGVRQRRDGSRFALEPRHAVGIGGEDLGQQLDRHLPAQRGVLRTPHHSHAALAELGDQAILEKGVTGIDLQKGDLV
jgi:hypothetical protein